MEGGILQHRLQLCSGLIPRSLLWNNSWWCLRDHINCWQSNQGQPHGRQEPQFLYCTIFPGHFCTLSSPQILISVVSLEKSSRRSWLLHSNTACFWRPTHFPLPCVLLFPFSMMYNYFLQSNGDKSYLLEMC